MAQAIWEDMLEKEGFKKNEDYTVGSAGIFASPGSPASVEAIKVMEELGVDLRHHRSQMINDELLAQADIILTMTRSQRDLLRSEYPDQKARVFTLADYVEQEDADILDPFGMGTDTYRDAANQIKRLLLRLFDKYVSRFKKNNVSE